MSSPTMLQRILSRRMLLCCTTGFASGMPLYVLYQLVPAWLRDQGVDLKTIGLFSLISIPYVWKFLWAPLMDQPFPLGRRRGWGLLSQILLTVLLASLALLNPIQNIQMIAGVCFLIAFCSASQDIVLDAYRRELLPDEEQGLGASLFVNAYRLSSLVPGSLALLLADNYPWAVSHMVVAGFMSVGIVTSLLMPEPTIQTEKTFSFSSAVSEPLKEFGNRNGWGSALLIILFMLCYKLGDSMATALATPFYLDLGFTKTDIASIVKVASLWSSIVGGLIGGLVMIRIGINRSLWIFGVVQLMTILGFAYLAHDSKILPMTELSDRTVENMQQATGNLRLSRWLEDDSSQEPIYVNEDLGHKKVKFCADLLEEGAGFSFVDGQFLSDAEIEPLRSVCPNLNHRIRLNVVSNDVLQQVFTKKEYDSFVKIQKETPFVTTFDELDSLKFSSTRKQELKEQVILKGNARFAPAGLLAKIPGFSPSGWLLFLVVSAEYLGVGLGTAAFVAFIATKTNRAYTAAQFALLTSISGLPRTFASSITGYLITYLGYTVFFLFCTILAIPGMLLLFAVAPWNTAKETDEEES